MRRRKKEEKEKKKIKRKLIKIAIGTLITSHIQVLPYVVYVYILYQGSHSILKLKIEENRGDSRRNFVKFEIFPTFSNEIKENSKDFSKSMRNGAFAIEAFNITVFI